jgi:hypothetical protein
MTLINNGKYRKTDFTIAKKINGEYVSNSQFPKTYSILNSFSAFPAITEEQFKLMSDVNYTDRLNEFYNFLESENEIFDRDFLNEIPFGENFSICSLPGSIPIQSGTCYRVQLTKHIWEPVKEFYMLRTRNPNDVVLDRPMHLYPTTIETEEFFVVVVCSIEPPVFLIDGEIINQPSWIVVEYGGACLTDNECGI